MVPAAVAEEGELVVATVRCTAAVVVVAAQEVSTVVVVGVQWCTGVVGTAPESHTAAEAAHIFVATWPSVLEQGPQISHP